MFIPKKKVSIVIPSEDNHGIPLDSERALICDRLTNIAGGCSVVSSWGAWLDTDGTRYEGSGHVVYTYVTQGPSLDYLIRLLPEFALLLRQIALLVTIEDALVAEVEGIREQASNQAA